VPLSDRHIAQWQKTRKLGRRRFIIRYGVLRWGLCTALLWSTLMYFWNEPGQFWVTLGIGVALFPIGGYGWAAAMWRINERAWHKCERRGPA